MRWTLLLFIAATMRPSAPVATICQLASGMVVAVASGEDAGGGGATGAGFGGL
jgi:hypothetical protein